MSHKRKIIGVCGTQIFNQIPMQFINTLRDLCVDKDYYIIAFSSNSYYEGEKDSIGEEQLFELLKYVDFSGLIILTETMKNPNFVRIVTEIAKKKKIPVFSVDGAIAGCYNMRMDYHDGFEQVMRHIVEEHGCRNVNMVAGLRDNAISDERVEVYKKVLADNNIPFEEKRLAYGDFWDRPTRRAMESFRQEMEEPPEAIVCANDAMAVTVCSVLTEWGYRVPEDIIVTGFDGTKDGKYHFPKLTTCEPDYESAGNFILEEIGKVEESGRIAPCDYNICFSISKAQSCGCENKSGDDINPLISSLAKDIGDCAWHNIAMNNMVGEMVDCGNIKEIVKGLPKYINLWHDTFRFACLKSDLMQFHELMDTGDDLTTILWDYKGEFSEPGEEFHVSQFMPHLDDLMKKENDIDILVVHLLNYGNTVYGYFMEGMQELDSRHLQRCNELAMFLSFSIANVLHNYQMKKLNDNLSRAYNQISRLYILDPMTGIYNRRGFSQKLGEMVAAEENLGKYLYLFSIDMDGLKYINDNFGHGEGDFAITALSKALAKATGIGAIYSRFGGDEFECAIVDEKSDVYSAEELSEKMAKCISEISGVKSKPYTIAASVGMISKRIEKDMDVDSLFQQADQLMYADKAARKQKR